MPNSSSTDDGVATDCRVVELAALVHNRGALFTAREVLLYTLGGRTADGAVAVAHLWGNDPQTLWIWTHSLHASSVVVVLRTVVPGAEYEETCERKC